MVRHCPVKNVLGDTVKEIVKLRVMNVYQKVCKIKLRTLVGSLAGQLIGDQLFGVN